jgi:hypothetical protein
MPPRGTSSSKVQGKARAEAAALSPAAPITPVEFRAPRAVHPNVLEALTVLWNSLRQFVVINPAGAFVAFEDIPVFLKTHVPFLVRFRPFLYSDPFLT